MAQITIPTDTVATDIGYFVVLKNTRDRTSNYIRKGGYERWMHSLIDKYADKGKIAIDMGSSLGYHAAYMSTKFRHVLAFEPQVIIADISERSFALDGFTNITVFRNVCSDTTGTIDFPDIDYNITKNIGGVSISYVGNGDPNTNSGWDGKTYIPIESVKVDDIFFGTFPDASVGFIKVDVEGHEYKALRGTEKVLRKFLCPIVIEMKDFPEGNIDRIHTLLTDIGYTIRSKVGVVGWDYLYTSS